MSKIVMIHEMHEGMPAIPPDLTLTFDDGLYTQYLYGRDLPNRKIFFISTNIICDGPQSSEFITCSEAHKKAFAGNKENYMTLDQIKELRDLGCEIGGHSHYHKCPDQIPKLQDKVAHIKEDTELMMEWFDKNLGFAPTQFCFPYNNDFLGVYSALLRRYGFTEFYGKERISIDDLQSGVQQPQ